MPFDQIAPIVERTPESIRRLASRERRRIEQADPAPDGDLAAQREVVDAFFAAGHAGDFDGLVAVLHPDAVLRGDFGADAVGFRVQGAASVAKLARRYAGPSARRVPRSSTAPQARSFSSAAARRPSWDSWCAADASRRSTCWPIQSASPNWI